jgi:hypothetical protein
MMKYQVEGGQSALEEEEWKDRCVLYEYTVTMHDQNQAFIQKF